MVGGCNNRVQEGYISVTEVVKVLRTTGGCFRHWKESYSSAGQMVCETDDRKLTNATPMHFLPSPQKKNLLYLGKAGTNVEKSIQSLKQGSGEQAEWPAVFSGFPSQAH